MACHGISGVGCVTSLVSGDCLGCGRCNRKYSNDRKDGGYQIFLPLIFPTMVVVVLALGVLLLVRTLFDGAAWRLDRLVFRYARIDPKIGLQRIISKTTVVRVVISFLGVAVLFSAAWLFAGPLIAVLSDFSVSFSRGTGQGSEVLSAAVSYLRGILAVAGIVSAFDWWLQRFSFERKIRMTHSE